MLSLTGAVIPFERRVTPVVPILDVIVTALVLVGIALEVRPRRRGNDDPSGLVPVSGRGHASVRRRQGGYLGRRVMYDLYGGYHGRLVGQERLIGCGGRG